MPREIKTPLRYAAGTDQPVVVKKRGRPKKIVAEPVFVIGDDDDSEVEILDEPKQPSKRKKCDDDPDWAVAKRTPGRPRGRPEKPKTHQPTIPPAPTIQKPNEVIPTSVPAQKKQAPASKPAPASKTTPASKPAPASKSVPASKSLPVSTVVELFMECRDEPLSQIQIQTAKKEQAQFEQSQTLVKAAREGRLIFLPGGNTQILEKPFSMVYTPQTPPTPVARLPAAPTPAQTPPPFNTEISANRPASPDLVIVGETPPRRQSTSLRSPGVPSPMSPPTPIGSFIQGAHGMGVKHPQGWQPLELSQQLAPGQTAFSKPQAVPETMTSVQVKAQSEAIAHLRQQMQQQAQAKAESEPMKKRTKKLAQMEADDSGNWVPLDEYYYGKMEGNPTYQEQKGELRFKCWYCNKMLYNNVAAMMHIQGHIDSERQVNLDLSDLTQCKHCYKQFDTPFEMQTHIEKVHMNNTNVLLCRICEKDHENRHALTDHMRRNHNACEMPYICQLCKFRSSMYSDVVDHFKKKHNSSESMLCLYCLRVFHVRFVSQGWGQTSIYYNHLMKHQIKHCCRKCQHCKLIFLNPNDLKSHRKLDHLPNQKGVIGMNAKYTTPHQVMIKVTEKCDSVGGIKSLNVPAVKKIMDHKLIFPPSLYKVKCIECKMLMGIPDHYKKFIQCSMCRFATSCSFAYANHMMGFHSGQMTAAASHTPTEGKLEEQLYCACGFVSSYGNRIANHLVACSKSSCSKDMPPPSASEEFGLELQDPRKKPDASLLDVLGLVKKDTLQSAVARRDSPPPEPVDMPEVPTLDVLPKRPSLLGDSKKKTLKNSLKRGKGVELSESKQKENNATGAENLEQDVKDTDTKTEGESEKETMKADDPTPSGGDVETKMADAPTPSGGDIEGPNVDVSEDKLKLEEEQDKEREIIGDTNKTVDSDENVLKDNTEEMEEDEKSSAEVASDEEESLLKDDIDSQNMSVEPLGVKFSSKDSDLCEKDAEENEMSSDNTGNSGDVKCGALKTEDPGSRTAGDLDVELDNKSEYKTEKPVAELDNVEAENLVSSQGCKNDLGRSDQLTSDNSKEESPEEPVSNNAQCQDDSSGKDSDIQLEDKTQYESLERDEDNIHGQGIRQHSSVKSLETDVDSVELQKQALRQDGSETNSEITQLQDLRQKTPDESLETVVDSVELQARILGQGSPVKRPEGPRGLVEDYASSSDEEEEVMNPVSFNVSDIPLPSSEPDANEYVAADKASEEESTAFSKGLRSESCAGLVLTEYSIEDSVSKCQEGMVVKVDEQLDVSVKDAESKTAEELSSYEDSQSTDFKSLFNEAPNLEGEQTIMAEQDMDIDEGSGSRVLTEELNGDKEHLALTPGEAFDELSLDLAQKFDEEHQASSSISETSDSQQVTLPTSSSSSSFGNLNQVDLTERISDVFSRDSIGEGSSDARDWSGNFPAAQQSSSSLTLGDPAGQVCTFSQKGFLSQDLAVKNLEKVLEPSSSSDGVVAPEKFLAAQTFTDDIVSEKFVDDTQASSDDVEPEELSAAQTYTGDFVSEKPSAAQTNTGDVAPEDPKPQTSTGPLLEDGISGGSEKAADYPPQESALVSHQEPSQPDPPVSASSSQERDRERRERSRSRDRHRDRRSRSRDRQWDRYSDRDRHRDRYDRDRDRDRYHDRSRDRDRHYDRSRDRERNRSRDRERDRSRERDHNRERDRSRENDRDSGRSRDRSRDRDYRRRDDRRHR